MKRYINRIKHRVSVYYVAPPERFWYFGINVHREYGIYQIRICRWLIDWSVAHSTYR